MLGIDMFLAVSLLTCLLDEHFPPVIPYIYQAAALIGFGHLLVSREFMLIFGDQMRFWYSAFYLAVSLGNVVAANFYVGVSKGQWALAKVFFGAVTFPTVLACSFFVSGYITSVSPYVSFPAIPMVFLYTALAISTAVLGIGVLVTHRLGLKHVEREVIG